MRGSGEMVKPNIETGREERGDTDMVMMKQTERTTDSTRSRQGPTIKEQRPIPIQRKTKMIVCDDRGTER